MNLNMLQPSGRFRLIQSIACSAVLLGTVALSCSVSAAELARQDKNFLIKAAQAGKTEVLASQLAENKATNAEVKSFASTMAQDHAKVGDELKQLASNKGVAVPESPARGQQSEINKLSKLDGDKFDKKYTKDIGLKAHKDAVALFKKASNDAKDPDIKAFAAKTLPSLEHHLQMAEALKASTDK